MSDRDGTSQEFGFPTSDHAGGSSRRPQHQQQYGTYITGRSSNVQASSSLISQAAGQESSLGYGEFDDQQHVAPDYAGFGYNPSAPLNWDWNGAIDLDGFSSQYEPQGELVQEFQQQAIPNDFTIPLPVLAEATDYHPFQQAHSAIPTSTAAQSQKPISPRPPPRSSKSRPTIQAGMKRKVDSEPALPAPQVASHTAEMPNKRQNISRQSSESSVASPVVAGPPNIRPPHVTRGAATATAEPISRSASLEEPQSERIKESSKNIGTQRRDIDTSKPRKVVDSDVMDLLPAGKVFPIQIGSELFRLSGASLSSDAPSYFSHFFCHQLQENGGRAGDVKTLYIDRDPDTFRDIALHLQGYHVTPKDGEHYVRLYADAQFYSLPRLTKQLFKTDIFVSIGGTPFQIPRDLFSAPGDSPNYFSLGFAQFFSTPSEVFPGLDRSALLRPPSISPPSVPNRSAEVFRELLQLLQGYDLEIRDEDHRSRLLRDARYFNLKGLEQRLILYEISYNLKRQQSEILIRLEDIRQSGVSFSPDKYPSESDLGSTTGGISSGVSPLPGSVSIAASPVPSTASNSTCITRAGFVTYARPFTDDAAQNYTLVLETSATESARIYLATEAHGLMQSSEIELQATFHNATLTRITSLFSVIAAKLGWPTSRPSGPIHQQPRSGIAAQPVSPANSGISDHRVRIKLDGDCAILLDGDPAEVAMHAESGTMGIRRCGNGHGSRAALPDRPRIENEWLWSGSTLHHSDDSLRTGEYAEVEWTVKRAQWRVRLEPIESDTDGGKMQVILCAVKIEASTIERTRNQARGFLGGG